MRNVRKGSSDPTQNSWYQYWIGAPLTSAALLSKIEDYASLRQTRCRLPSSWTSQERLRGLELWHLNDHRHCCNIFIIFMLMIIYISGQRKSVHVPFLFMSRMRALASQQLSCITRNSFPSFIIWASPWSTAFIHSHRSQTNTIIDGEHNKSSFFFFQCPVTWRNSNRFNHTMAGQCIGTNPVSSYGWFTDVESSIAVGCCSAFNECV